MIWAGLLGACWNAGDGASPSDADTSSDTGTGTDTGSDISTDTDTGTGTDTDSDSDSGTDTADSIPDDELPFSWLGCHSAESPLAIVSSDDVVLCGGYGEPPVWYDGEEEHVQDIWWEGEGEPFSNFQCHTAFSTSTGEVVLWGRYMGIEGSMVYERVGGPGGEWALVDEFADGGYCVWGETSGGDPFCVWDDPNAPGARRVWRGVSDSVDWVDDPTLAPSYEQMPVITEICPGNGDVFVEAERHGSARVVEWVDGEAVDLGYPYDDIVYGAYIGGANCIHGSAGGEILVLAPRQDRLVRYDGEEWSTVLECPSGVIPSYLPPDDERICWTDAARDPSDGAYYLIGGLDCGDGLCPEDDVRIHRYREGEWTQVMLPYQNPQQYSGDRVSIVDNHLFATVGYYANFKMAFTELQQTW